MIRNAHYICDIIGMHTIFGLIMSHYICDIISQAFFKQSVNTFDLFKTRSQPYYTGKDFENLPFMASDAEKH